MKNSASSPDRAAARRLSSHYSRIEPLESRIAPAAVFSFTDVDGDKVTITTSHGQDADLAAVISSTSPVGAVTGGIHITAINLAAKMIFDGTDISITAKPGPLGGDGLVSINAINATALDLGKVMIKGDLADFDGGKAGQKIDSITLHSTSGTSIWNIAGSVGSLTVAENLRGAEIHIDDVNATLGSLKIGGSLIGEVATRTGYVSVLNGTITKLSIGGDIIGGSGNTDGVIIAKNIGSATIGGNIFGGTNADSGKITVTSTLGTLLVKGNVTGGGGVNSGIIHSDATLGNITIKGSLTGGSAFHSGNIEAATGIGFVSIGRDQHGGTFTDTGDIQSPGGGIKGVTIGGSLIGGLSNFSGRIVAGSGNIGPIKISGDLQSTERDAAGVLLSDTGIIFARAGTNTDAAKVNITSVTVGGSVIGGATTSVSQIFADGAIGSVKIGRDLRAGAGSGSGSVIGYNGLGSVTIGGSLLGATGSLTGAIWAVTGPLASVKIGGSMTGGGILSGVSIGNVTIGGSLSATTLVGSGSITSAGTLGAVKIGGSMVGSVGVNATIVAGGAATGSVTAIKSISVGGRVENATITAGVNSSNPDVKIGAVKVGGDWIASNLAVGVGAGADGKYGTGDDVAVTQMGEPDTLFSKIASIVIGGKVYGTVGTTDHFGFVCEEIGSMKVNGVSIPLTAGHSTDADVTNSRLILGDSRDVTVHEVA